MDTVTNEVPQNAEIIEMGGKQFMINAKGDHIALANVKAADKLQDETVRKIIGYAVELNAQINRFRSHTMLDLGAFDALLAQEYGTKIGGKKGNRTYQTFDGLMKVEVKVADQIDFGPELQIAKSLLDECMTEWTADSRPEIQSIITRAFNTDREGQINRSELFMLLRLDIEDERWLRAMDAIRNSIRVTGSKEYVRFYRRASINDQFQAITIDLAKAGA
ncbi:hypothetical protein ABID16_000072 [Rhizobium aquaticum]|uniref:Sulfate transporter n=1 Tax=Rhizobium aquaticum TaxID=1549636 RepID=A0ABV2ITG2_9HYPH